MRNDEETFVPEFEGIISLGCETSIPEEDINAQIIFDFLVSIGVLAAYDDNFFYCGITSLHMMTLVTFIRQKFLKEMSVNDLLLHNSIRMLSVFVKNAEKLSYSLAPRRSVSKQKNNEIYNDSEEIALELPTLAGISNSVNHFHIVSYFISLFLMLYSSSTVAVSSILKEKLSVESYKGNDIFIKTFLSVLYFTIIFYFVFFIFSVTAHLIFWRIPFSMRVFKKIKFSVFMFSMGRLSSKVIASTYFFLRIFSETEFQNSLLRLMGCKIGKNCHIRITNAMFDCGINNIYIEDNVFISIGCILRPYYANLFNTSVGIINIQSEAFLSPGTVLSNSAFIPKKTSTKYFSNATSAYDMNMFETHEYLNIAPTDTLHDCFQFFYSIFCMNLHLIFFVLSQVLVFIISDLYLENNIYVTVIMIPIFGKISYYFQAYIVGSLVPYLVKPLNAKETVRVGTWKYTFSLWMQQLNFEHLSAPLLTISGSSGYSKFLEKTGAKMGNDVISSGPLGNFIHPSNLVEFQDEVFIGSNVIVGSLKISSGVFSCSKLTIGRKSFISNNSIVASCYFPPNSSLAVLSSFEETSDKSADSQLYLGIPAKPMPFNSRNETINDEDSVSSELFTAYLMAYSVVQSCIEGIVSLPNFIASTYLQSIDLSKYNIHLNLYIVFILLNTLLSVCALIITFILLLITKQIVGKFNAESHNYFSVWQMKRTVYYCGITLFYGIANATFYLSGTRIHNWALNSIGANINKNSIVEGNVTEVDLISIDEATFTQNGSIIQTNTYEDRIMKLDEIFIGPGCLLGNQSCILPGSQLDAFVHIQPNTLVMRDDHVSMCTTWQGNPMKTIANDLVTFD